MLNIDAIVLAGGRSSRLGGTPKGALPYRGRTLLDGVVAAARPYARRIAIVGDEAGPPRDDTVLVRELPAFGGPVAGIAAGVDALSRDDPGDGAEWLMVLACDLPHADLLATELVRSSPGSADGLVADDGRSLQPLAAVYRASRLAGALSALAEQRKLSGTAVFRLIDGFELRPVAVSETAAQDVDTWEDALAFGIRPRPEEET